MKLTTLVCMVALACAIGCGGDDDGGGGGGGGGADASTGGGVDASGGGGGVDASTGTATFTQVYAIISTSCAPCHTTANGTGVTSGQLDMTSQATAYDNLVGVAAAGSSCSGMGTRVVANDAANSIMFLKVEPGQASPCGSKMPVGSSGLSADDAALVQAWIEAGAMND